MPINIFRGPLILFAIWIGLLSGPAWAWEFHLEILLTTPGRTGDARALTQRLILGVQDQATDDFDTAWDLPAIRAGGLQGHLTLSDDPAHQALWRDTRASTGALPKTWHLQVSARQVGVPVTLSWSAEVLSALPPDRKIKLIPPVGTGPEIDMQQTASYTYNQGEAGQARDFKVVLYDPNSSGHDSLEIETQSLPQGSLRKSYTTRLQAYAGLPPYQWIRMSGTLPPGLRLDPDTGIIHGLPRRAGIYHTTIQVSDTQGLNQQRTYIIVIE